MILVYCAQEKRAYAICNPVQAPGFLSGLNQASFHRLGIRGLEGTGVGPEFAGQQVESIRISGRQSEPVSQG